MPSGTDAMSIISEFVPLAERRVLDIGCGGGTLARSLAAQGAFVYGVDPNAEALAVAREAVPEGVFHRAAAEALPFADQMFDGAVFLNSLHHVPRPAMDQALREASRVVKPAGPIVVIEPLAEGSFFSVLRLVEDETNIRAAAQEAIERVIEGGSLAQIYHTDYMRRECFTDLDQFLTHVVAVDPERAGIVAERRSEIEAAFDRYAQPGADNRLTLEQPLRARILTTGV